MEGSRLALIKPEQAPFAKLGDFSALPEEIFLYILGELPASVLCSTRSVCTRWNELSRNSFLWQKMCERHLPGVKKPENKTSEWLYKSKKYVLKQIDNLHGVGVYTWENGDKYEGEWLVCFMY